MSLGPLEEMFRQATLHMMLKDGKITLQPAELSRSLVHSGFHVNSDLRVEAGDRPGLECLLEYMERAPIPLERHTCREDGRVIYRRPKHWLFWSCSSTPPPVTWSSYSDRPASLWRKWSATTYRLVAFWENSPCMQPAICPPSIDTFLGARANASWGCASIDGDDS